MTTAVLFMSLLQLQDTRFCKIHTHLNSDGNHGSNLTSAHNHSFKMFTQLDIQDASGIKNKVISDGKIHDDMTTLLQHLKH